MAKKPLEIRVTVHAVYTYQRSYVNCSTYLKCHLLFAPHYQVSCKGQYLVNYTISKSPNHTIKGQNWFELSPRFLVITWPYFNQFHISGTIVKCCFRQYLVKDISHQSKVSYFHCRNRLAKLTMYFMSTATQNQLPYCRRVLILAISGLSLNFNILSAFLIMLYWIW